MAIPEEQLEVWSKQGSISGSRDTYAAIKGALEDANAPYSGHGFSTFLQGSYGNDTNVWSESDVDVVMRLDDAFQYDVDRLTDDSRARFDRAYAGVPYGYAEFKVEVASWMRAKYGNTVHVGTKAIRVDGNGNRRDADVLPCMRFRRYHRFNAMYDESYVEGICFYRNDGLRIENYPKQHADNCTTKHQGTNGWFKPMARVIKNMRNRMVSGGLIRDGLAPSYYIEGLLYNLPSPLFDHSFERTFLQFWNWTSRADKTNFVTANEQFYLLRNGFPTSWEPADCEDFLTALARFWDDW
ncbi:MULTISPECIES: nucleotidyltransferase [unclassified Devosia]|uniref:nucleotidyltransferase domain-containing protein n=1 Tax=unclassified Devosia TaxID=196773 RepID=UPI000868CA04|nr:MULTISPECIES: nucleotidyltransferase [unclassified Devosia]MBO9590613.1 nucleotidyltransferase [Devosia sp.]ODT47765.1 MAG: hypothetical protein ABS74_16150 [Pelagibacterium sp. SCN 63-126]ODU80428.1 MAG: hypothetical protein ABT14_18950 [Pelagibacterium sp. SCN 63-17]OJX42526.1 MAG: nucleotidyltransferase [Devosia sp. 63-57]